MAKKWTARNPQTVKEHLFRDALLHSGEGLKKGHKGALTGYLNKYMGGDENRRLALSWLFFSDDGKKLKPKSSADLSEAQWYALNRWVNASYDEETGKWEPDPIFTVESALVITHSIREYNSTPLSVRKELESIKPSDIEIALVRDMDGVITSMLDNDGELLSSRDVAAPPYAYRSSKKDENIRKQTADPKEIKNRKVEF